MKTISPEQYVEGVNSIYVEQPAYDEGHDGSDGKCDCIGMPRGALEREGVTGVSGMNGTNYAARKTIEDLKPIRSTAELQLGDVVLKTRAKNDKSYPLPERYRKGNADYDQKWGETNFTHIGTVTRVDPLEITHMTSPTAQKDTKLGNWKYAGRLPWVKRGSEPEPVKEWATVTADEGSTVKMRAKASTKCRLYWDVPIGSRVTVVERGDTWTKISWAGQGGYMLNKFLRFEGEPGLYTVIIPGLTMEQANRLLADYPGAELSAG